MYERTDTKVYADPDSDRAKVEEIAGELGVSLSYDAPDPDDEAPVLRLTAEGLQLTGGGLTLYGDFTHMLPRLRDQNLRSELLIRAAKIKSFGERPTAVDATAGLGEDSLLLAAAGFSVSLFEYNPVIALLLQDSMRRAAEVPELADIIKRMRLFKANSLEALPALSFSPDVVLLDPMFPARQKSGLIKKKFQLLHRIERPCSDEAALLQAALAANPRKIIIKRPSKGLYLSGAKPHYSIERGGIRYDCLVPPHNDPSRA